MIINTDRAVPTKALFGIRPLEWERTKTPYSERYITYVPMGHYEVERIRDDFDVDKPWGPWRLKYYFVEYYDEGEDEVESLKDGKEKAMKNWIDRIMPALVEIPNASLEARADTTNNGGSGDE